MGKRIYIMTHGQTLFNQMGRIQGWSDSPLTDEGQRQALAVRQFLEGEGIGFDRLYSSSSERCCDTMELVTGQMDYVRLKGLNEWNFGRMEAQQDSLFPNRANLYESFNDFYVQYDGESEEHFQARVSRTLFSIISDLDEGQSGFVVSNTGVIIQFLHMIGLEDYVETCFHHGIVYVFEVSGEECSLIRIVKPLEDVLDIIR